MADSFQSSSSSSSSTPTVLNTPQSDWGLQLSKVLSILAQGQYSWAMDQYNNGKTITDSMINNFMQLSGQGAGLAQSLISQYHDQFAPLNAQYIAQANSYNSEARQEQMSGLAKSGVNQSMTAAMNNSRRVLQGFGLNPSDGQSRALEEIMRSERAAAMAGAGQKAILDTADRGRAMTEKAIQFGQNVPGMAVNATNSATQASTAGQNANLGQQNAGATLSQTAAPFFNASAAANKIPPVGQTSRSGSSSSGGSNGSGGSGNGSGSGRQGSGYDPLHPTNPNDMGYPNGSGGPGAKTVTNNNRGGGGGGGGASPNGSVGGSMARFIPVGGQPPEGEQPQPDWTNPDWTGIGQGDGRGTGAPTDWTNPDWTGIGQGDGSDQFTDPYGDTGGNAQDPYGDNQGGSGDFTADSSSMPSGGDNSYGDFYSGQDTGGSSGYSGEGAVTDTTDMSNFGDTSFDSGGGYDEEFAEGGPVPVRASPSRGRQTDDISARLNAGEYVIPRDVVSHRGPGYFRSLIEQSRRSRSGVSGPPPKAKLRPALNQAPSFVSR